MKQYLEAEVTIDSPCSVGGNTFGEHLNALSKGRWRPIWETFQRFWSDSAEGVYYSVMMERDVE